MPILIGSAAMAGAAITPPTTKAVEPNRSFFIFLPLSLIRDWYVPKGLSDRRNVEARLAAAHGLRQCDRNNRTHGQKKGQEMVALPPNSSPDLWRLCHNFGLPSASMPPQLPHLAIA